MHYLGSTAISSRPSSTPEFGIIKTFNILQSNGGSIVHFISVFDFYFLLDVILSIAVCLTNLWKNL